MNRTVDPRADSTAADPLCSLDINIILVLAGRGLEKAACSTVKSIFLWREG